MPLKNKRRRGTYHKPTRRSGVRHKHGTAPEPEGPKPWPAGKPAGGKLQVKRRPDGTIELTPIED